MHHSGTHLFVSYWHSLQKTPDRAPERARFDPAQLKRLVPQMIMLSAREKGLPFRLAGAFSVRVHGRELKNAPFVDLFRETFHIPLLAAMRQSLRKARPLVLSVEADWTGRHGLDHPLPVDMEISLCPLTGADGRVDRFVGLYQTDTDLSRAGKGQLSPLRLTSSRLIEGPLSDMQSDNTVTRPAHLQLISLEGRRIA